MSADALQASGKLSRDAVAFESRQMQFIGELDNLEESFFELLKVPQFKTAWQLLRVGCKCRHQHLLETVLDIDTLYVTSYVQVLLLREIWRKRMTTSGRQHWQQ